MSLGLTIQFLAHRYHATPWDHQVNEGVVEWPPSPWRILRALVAGSYRLPEPVDRDLLVQLVTKLAAEAPRYGLPETSAAHTRHYMPIWREGKATTTKVLDTFLAMGKEKDQSIVKVLWPNVSLDAAETDLLNLLCRQVAYLGRAESWAQLQVNPVAIEDCPVVPAEIAEPSLGDEEKKVLVPLSSEKLAGFRAAVAAFPKPKRGQAKWTAPGNVLEALEADVGELHAQGWQGIPGAEWVRYVVPQHQQKIRPKPSLLRFEANFARFALVSKEPILVKHALSLGERFRQALMSRSRNEAGEADTLFSGRDAEGNPLRDNHSHAWYLPEVDGRGQITHVVVCCRQPFSDQAIKALQRLDRVWGHGDFDIQTLLVAFGDVEYYRAESGNLDPGRSPLVGRSRVWRSLTPMVLPRHEKKNKIDPETGLKVDGPEYQVRWLLDKLGLPCSCDELQVRECPSSRAAVWGPQRRLNEADYQRQRRSGQGARRAKDTGHWFELEFESPQSGPIAIGYGAHFGLGVFVPTD